MGSGVQELTGTDSDRDTKLFFKLIVISTQLSHLRLSLPSIMSLIAALLIGDIVDPEDEEDHDDGPLNPTTLKQEW